MSNKPRKQRKAKRSIVY